MIVCSTVHIHSESDLKRMNHMIDPGFVLKTAFGANPYNSYVLEFYGTMVALKNEVSMNSITISLIFILLIYERDENI